MFTPEKEAVDFIEIGNVKYINEEYFLEGFRNYLRTLIRTGVIEINENNEDYFKIIKLTK